MGRFRLLSGAAGALALAVALALAGAPGPVQPPTRTMYARSSAAVRDRPTFSAATIARLQQGDPVSIAGMQGRYYKVSLEGRTGWVYQNKLSDDKPEDVADLLAGSAGGQIQLSELEAGGALRGLSPLAEDYAKNAQAPPWAIQAVEDMGSRVLKPEDLESFQKEGRLGEYGEGVGP